ncbi:hypothetical protein D9619_002222 [Psilocybe cf. subviscida]|uniref:F-box domain-containing protein n=1 Tax=Psilocybe cf. subviscida TaxID=2480587 RepID=A0A8H5BET3_9AGAR|nr:hypothetical protein D9619_002222 [Psilocybe cf. subviscida]
MSTSPDPSSESLLAERHSIRSQIADTEQALIGLKAYERDLNERLNEAVDPFTTFLPFEIISKILVEVVNPPPSRFGDRVHNEEKEHRWYSPNVVPIYEDRPASSAIELAFVCRSWRHIIYSLPEIWTSIEVDLTGPFRDCDIALLDDMCARSGSRPLSVSFTCFEPVEAEITSLAPRRMTKHWRNAFDTALKYSDRWTHLNVCLPPLIAIALRVISDFGPWTKCPNLKRLNVEFPPSLVISRDDYLLHRMEFHWDSITHLHASSDVYFNIISIPWRQLTHLRTSSFSYQEIFYILLRAPGLTHLTIDDVYHEDDSELAMVTHTCLQYLEIHVLVHIEDTCILAWAQLPALLELRIYDFKPRWNIEWELPVGVANVMPRAFMKSLTSLKRLEWDAMHNRRWSDDAVSILREVPTLESMEVRFVDTEVPTGEEYPRLDAFLEALTENVATRDVFLPQLQELSLQGQVHLRWAHVERIFAPEVQTYRPLRTLSLDFSGHASHIPQEPIDSWTFRWIKDLIDRGFALTIGEGPSPGSIIKQAIEDVSRGSSIPEAIFVSDR